MKRKAKIILTSVSFWGDAPNGSAYSQSLEEESVVRHLSADAVVTERQMTFSYQQILTEELQETVREIFVLTLDDNKNILQAELKRPEMKMHLVFSPGNIKQTIMPTPAGDLSVKVMTKRLTGRGRLNGADLSLSYELWLGEEKQGAIKIHLQARFID